MLLCAAMDFDDEPPPVEARFLTSFEGALVSFKDVFDFSLDSEGLEVSFLGFLGSSGSSSSTDSYEE